MYDCIIIGKGPAGISAAIYISRSNLKCLVIGKNENEDDDFVISKNTSNEEYVLLYDQILMEVISESDVSDKK